jgi:hypothetical protein
MTVADEHRGKKVRCPNCKLVLVVPASSPAVVAAPAPPVDPLAFLTTATTATAPVAPAPPTPAPEPARPPRTVEERLASLEAENAALKKRYASLKWGGIAAVAILAVLGTLPFVLGSVGGQAAFAAVPGGQPAAVVASRILLKDAAGATRAELGPSERDEVAFRLFAKNKVRTDLRITSTGVPALTCYDDAGKEQVTLLGGPDAGLNVYDKNADLRIQLGTSSDGSPSFSLRATELKTKVQLGVRPDDHAVFDLYDAKDQLFPLVAKDGTPLIPRADR